MDERKDKLDVARKAANVFRALLQIDVAAFRTLQTGVVELTTASGWFSLAVVLISGVSATDMVAVVLEMTIRSS